MKILHLTSLIISHVGAAGLQRGGREQQLQFCVSPVQCPSIASRPFIPPEFLLADPELNGQYWIMAATALALGLDGRNVHINTALGVSLCLAIRLDTSDLKQSRARSDRDKENSGWSASNYTCAMLKGFIKCNQDKIVNVNFEQFIPSNCPMYTNPNFLYPGTYSWRIYI